MKIFFLMISVFVISGYTEHASALNPADDDPASIESNSVFSDPETNFKLVMEKILSKHLNQKITKEYLYQIATEGMMKSLDSKHQTWNALLSPEDRHELAVDLSGKVTGIGLVFDFEKETGNGKVISLIANSPAKKAGLKEGDRILSIDGQNYKGKKMIDMTRSIRGSPGKAVTLKVLRDDQVLSFKVVREQIRWTPISYTMIDSRIALLTIGFFNSETPKMVEGFLEEFKKSGSKSLIIDLRNCEGGGFETAVKTAGLFLPVGGLIAQSRDRSGKVKEYRSQQSILPLWPSVTLLTDRGTYSGAELFVAALKENSKVKQVGENTAGKWSAQSVEELPNKFAIKYTVLEFLSPKGKSYQDQGIEPDITVMRSENVSLRELQSQSIMTTRLNQDHQLKAAVELLRSM